MGIAFTLLKSKNSASLLWESVGIRPPSNRIHDASHRQNLLFTLVHRD